MSAQLTYEQSPAIGFSGMLADNFSEPKQIDSGLAEGSAIKVGAVVSRGTGDAQYTAAVADAAIEGVAVHVSGQEQAADGSISFAEKSQLPVLKKGRFYGVANAAVLKGATLAYDPATDKWGAVSGGVTTLAGAIAVTSAAADADLIVLELALVG